MTAHTTITDAELTGGKPGKQSILRALRDNPVAIAERAASAPLVKGAKYDLIMPTTAASVASVEFAVTSTYNFYRLFCGNVIPATDNVQYRLETSFDGGSSWATTAGDYAYDYGAHDDGGTDRSAYNATTAGALVLGDAVGNGASRGGWSGSIDIFRPSASSVLRHFAYRGYFAQSPSLYVRINGGGYRNNSTTAINRIRLRFSSGNISSGQFELYGLYPSN